MAQCNHSAEQQAKWFNDGYCPQCADARARDLESRVRELEAALAASLKTVEERIPLLNRMVELEAERDRLREAYATDTQRLQARIQTLEECRAGNVWHWSAMDENHVESLTCPILISAEDMRAALKGEG